ncbi:MAG: hypothetical protein GX847_06575 [Clostridiales bacterium]|nr:hypothetical protein [Clostridiales bacterium]
MPKKKNEDIKPLVRKKSAASVMGNRLNPSSAKLGIIYAELLGPPVSKKRRIR